MNYNILTIFGLHTSNKQKFKSTINNIKYVNSFSKKILCIDSLELKNSSLKEKVTDKYKKVDFFYIDNCKNLLDVKKWIYGLQKINYTEFDYIILINDSICISRPLDSFFDMLYNINAEMYGMIDSFENNYHFQSFLRAFNKDGINKFIKYHFINNHKIQNPNQTIITFEIEIMKIFSKITSLYSIKDILNRSSKLNKLKNSIRFYYEYIFDMDKNYLKTRKVVNLHFNDKKYKYFLFNLNYPIIKLKKVNTCIYPLNYKLDEKDFNPTEYKNMHWDLCDIPSQDLMKHFIQHGIREGRKYKPTQDSCPPRYLVEYINKNNLNFLLN